METDLSWSDRVITPKTKSYKDFINEKENTPVEIWLRDGERIFTNQEKKFMQIYNYKNGIKETPVASVQEVPVIPTLETDAANKKVEISIILRHENQITIDKREEKEVVGKLSFYDNNGKITEEIKYNSPNSYINALQRELDSNMGG